MCLPPTKLGSGCMHNDISNAQKSAQFLSPAQNFEQPSLADQFSSIPALPELPRKLTRTQFYELMRHRRRGFEPCKICGRYCEVERILGQYPVSNTGGKSTEAQKTHPGNQAKDARKVSIDTLTISFPGINFDSSVKQVSKWLLRWTGGVLKVGGAVRSQYNGYQQCYVLVLASGEASLKLGWLGVSSVNDPMRGKWCIYITGAGCSCIDMAPQTLTETSKIWVNGDWVDYKDKDGVWINAWERLAMDVQPYGIKITRIDLAADDLSGEHSVEEAMQLHERGGFKIGGRNPKGRSIKNSDKGDGDTFTVGKKTSGKFLRVYEKGKEQGCKTSPWVRWEAQIMSIDRRIPARALCEPEQFLRGAYPDALSWIGSASQAIAVKIEKSKLTIEQALRWANQQVGSLIRYLKDVKGASDKDIVDHLIGREGRYPVRLTTYVLPDEPWLSPG